MASHMSTPLREPIGTVPVSWQIPIHDDMESTCPLHLAPDMILVIKYDTKVKSKRNTLKGDTSSTTVSPYQKLRHLSARVKACSTPLNLTTMVVEAKPRVLDNSGRRNTRLGSVIPSGLPAKASYTHPNNSCSRATAKKKLPARPKSPWPTRPPCQPGGGALT